LPSRFQLSGHLVKRRAADATLSAPGTNTWFEVDDAARFFARHLS
jgi:hypothetical protein